MEYLLLTEFIWNQAGMDTSSRGSRRRWWRATPPYWPQKKGPRCWRAVAR